MHTAVCISQPCVKLRVTAVSSDAELWQLFDVLPVKSEDDEVGWMPAHVQHTTGSRWKHLGNLALFRLAYIRKFWGHPLVKEAYETTMWESKQAPICLHNVPHFWNVSLVTPFQKAEKHLVLIYNRNWQLYCQYFCYRFALLFSAENKDAAGEKSSSF